MENRRSHYRYQVSVAAEVALGNEIYEAETQNMSEGGVSAVLEAPIPEDSTVDLTLILTQDGIEDPNEEPFEVQASVMWVAPSDDGSTMVGLRFKDVSDAQRTRIAQFLTLIA